MGLVEEVYPGILTPVEAVGFLLYVETPICPPLAVPLSILIGPFLNEDRIDLPYG